MGRKASLDSSPVLVREVYIAISGPEKQVWGSTEQFSSDGTRLRLESSLGQGSLRALSSGGRSPNPSRVSKP